MPAEYRIGRLKGRFVVTWWDDGKRRRRRLAALTRTEAEGEALDLIRANRAKVAGQTIGELWEMYREEKAGRRIADAMAFEWKAMQPFFGNLRPDQTSTELFRNYAKVRRGMGKGDGTIWTELGHLRTVFIWAANRRLIAYAPPVERPQKPAPKSRWLNDKEIAKLLTADAEHHIKLAILLMLGTAGRVSAILELTWDRVDFDGGYINLRTTETGPRKGRAVVPMNPTLRAALSAAKATALTDNVIEWAGSPVKSIKTGFNHAVIDAGFFVVRERGTIKPTISPHTLRHTAAVHMAAAGRPMSKISQYLGHSSTAVTERVYARYAPEHLQEESAVLDFARLLKVV